MSSFDEARDRAKLMAGLGNNFVCVNRKASPMAAELVSDMTDAIWGLLKCELPEIPQLEPIDFGPNDEDRVKDMFGKVFLLDYEYRRTVSDWQQSLHLARNSASEAATIYRRWLKTQESE